MASTGTCWEIFRPTGAGVVPNTFDSGDYTDVDEYVTDTSDYLGSVALSNGETQAASFSKPSSNVGAGTIISATVRGHTATVVGSPSATLYLGIDPDASGSTSFVDNDTPTSTPTDYDHVFTTNPLTASAWTWSAINTSQFGLQHAQESGAGNTVRTYTLSMIVAYTGIFWRDGAPNDGTAHTFVEYADKELVNYLSNYHPLTAGNHADLTNYLETEGIIWRAHDPLTELPPDESISNFPLAYVWTTGADPGRRITSSGLDVDCQTRIILYTQNARPETAGKQWWAIAGAIDSLINQLQDAPDNPAWQQHYANFEHPSTSIENVAYVDEGEDTNTVKGEIIINWTHLEDVY